ncbi:MAG TPA: DUF2769 domain-containing protein [Methanoregulaceae archaeon]|nr:DUF2769 domain-containing protein [Methanoregulaceae archaeon]HPD76441.1 DUF2769 domain-containing protein [Methanoregulaceae archaeon]
MESEKLFLRIDCSCPDCLTYNECMRADDERAFCISGRSSAPTFERKGCQCMSCPAAGKTGGKREYWCITGS